MRWEQQKGWHRWFAWHPVQCRCGTRVWLEPVVRLEIMGTSAVGRWSWTYKTPEQFSDDMLALADSRELRVTPPPTASASAASAAA